MATSVRTVYVAAGDEIKEGDKLVRLASGETIAADFDGRVNLVGAEEGDDVDADTTLVEIADFSHMTVSIRVDEYDIADVSVGQAVTVTATATEETFDSTIESINYISQSSGNVAYYTATADVDVSGGIYPGMQATVTITQQQADDVVILKEDALSFDAMNNAFVYTMDESGAMTEVSVTVGVSNGNYVEIKEGLADGDTVYVEAAEEETASGLSGLLSGLFGSRNISGAAGANRGDWTGEMPAGFGGDPASTGGFTGGMPGTGTAGGGQ
jgi:HlyD family secretion protein